MIPSTPSQVKATLDGLGLRPSKAMGQNFLADRNILRILLETAGLEPNDDVLEIGPGLGVLTEELASRAGSVLAVEKDRGLYGFLCDEFGASANVNIRKGDALDLELEELVTGKYRKVVANLPYSVGSRILIDLAMVSMPADLIVVTVQKEVADRLSASHGSKDFGILSLWVQMVYRVDVVRKISPSCFWPRPEVQSAIVRLTRRTKSLVDETTRPFLYALTKTVFSQRRKQLAALLGHCVIEPQHTKEQWQVVMRDLGVSPTVRPEGLSPEMWRDLIAGHVKALRQ